MCLNVKISFRFDNPQIWSGSFSRRLPFSVNFLPGSARWFGHQHFCTHGVLFVCFDISITVLTIITRNTWLVSGLFHRLSQEIISFRHWSVILIVVVLAVKILPNFIRSSCLVVEWFSRDTRQSYICVPTVSGSDLGWPPPPSPTQLSQHHFNTWQ